MSSEVKPNSLLHNVSQSLVGRHVFIKRGAFQGMQAKVLYCLNGGQCQLLLKHNQEVITLPTDSFIALRRTRGRIPFCLREE